MIAVSSSSIFGLDVVHRKRQGSLPPQMALDFTVVLTSSLFEFRSRPELRLDLEEGGSQLGRRVMGPLPSKWL